MGIERAFERSRFEDPSSLIWTRYATHHRIEFTRKVLWISALALSIVKVLFHIIFPPSSPRLHSINGIHSVVTLTFLGLSGLGAFLHYFSLSHPDISFLWRHSLLSLLTGVYWTLCHYKTGSLGCLKNTTEWDRVWDFPSSMELYWWWIDVSFFTSLIIVRVCDIL